jgi:hypothetical protein
MDLLQENALGVKVPSGETILTKYLNGYTATVVVTGNEKAALNDTTPLAAGKTEVDNDTILNWTTGLDEIGSSYTIWAVKGGAQKQDTVVYSELSADNAYYETHEATKGAGITAKDTGLNLDTAEKFVNFDNSEVYSTTIKLTYDRMVKVTAGTGDYNLDSGEYVKAANGDYKIDTVTVKAGNPVDTAELKEVFKYNALSVYVGTYNASANYVDQSDDMNYTQFAKKYLEVDTDAAGATTNVNGDYIKVIDNDGDGVAEYILKTEYDMDAIKSVAKNKYTLAIEGTVDADAISSEDELAAGDVIVYALIDGVYYTNLADTATITIAKKGIDFKAETITDGENTYEQSGIRPVTADDGTQSAAQKAFDGNFAYDTFEFELTAASAEKTYDLYLDNYGYVRAYTLNKYTYSLGLLTNASYYTDGRKTTTAQVEMVVNPDTDSTDYDVDTSIRDWNVAKFIDDESDVSDKGSAGTWGRLNGFKGAKTTFGTNIASYTNNDDVLTLADPAVVNGYTNRTLDVIKSELNLTNVDSLKNAKYTTLETSGTAKTVYATTDTVYYYVDAVTLNVKATWVGYSNAPKALTLTSADAAYTVAVKNSDNGTYYTANVIVIEANSSSSALNFVYFANTNKTGTNVSSYWLNTIALNDDGDVDTETYVDEATGTIGSDPAFYTIANDRVGTTKAVTAYTANGIYAGESLVGASVNTRDYVDVQLNVGGVVKSERFQIGVGGTPVYQVSKANKTNAYVAYSIEECTSVGIGDELIYVKSGNTVLYAINVTKSKDALGAYVGNLDQLWLAIANENKAYGTGDPTVTFFGKQAAVSGTTINAEVTYAEYLAAKGNSNQLTVTNGSFVITSVPTDATLNTITTAGYTNTALTVLGTNGKYYTVNLTVDAQEAIRGVLKSKNDSLAKVVTKADGTQVVEISTTTQAQLTIAGLEDLLSVVGDDQNEESVKIVAKDAAGKTISSGALDQPLTAAATLEIYIENAAEGQSKKIDVDLDDSFTTSYLLTLTGVTAYTDAKCTKPLGSNYVVSGVQVYFKAEGAGTITATGTSLTTPSATTNGVTTAAISSVGANTTVTFAAETTLSKAAAAVTAASEQKLKSTDPNTKGADLVKEAVDGILSAQNISGVTVTFKSGPKVTTAFANDNTANTKSSGAQPTVTLSDGTKTVDVQVSVEMTHLYTEKELTDAINAAIASGSYNQATAELVKTAVETQIITVIDITTGAAVVVNSVNVVSQTGKIESKAIVDVTYTVTYNGQPVSGSTTITLN